MDIENHIEMQYRQLISSSQVNVEFADLYLTIEHQKLREILTTLHYNLISLFEMMNQRLPTGDSGAHYWADQSRNLINNIEIAIGLFNALKKTKYAFEIDKYYFTLLKQCQDFLSPSGGSQLPANMSKIELYYTIPIFKLTSNITVSNKSKELNFDLKFIGRGSYSNVYKYKDTFYNKRFALKRAKKELTDEELVRFKQEFKEMSKLYSPYIIEVYCYNETENEYIMEYMDFTLDEYISKNITKTSYRHRKGIGLQILKAFDYIHSKDRLHRDISPKNILIKKYDDVAVVKIADFGLIKIPDSTLTTASTEFKGYFNDPSLILDGFKTYDILHETFALTRVIYYVLTGKTNVDNISNPKLNEFVSKGLNVDKSLRFKDVNEMIQAFHGL